MMTAHGQQQNIQFIFRTIEVQNISVQLYGLSLRYKKNALMPYNNPVLKAILWISLIFSALLLRE
jgi:hypothetical protein